MCYSLSFGTIPLGGDGFTLPPNALERKYIHASCFKWLPLLYFNLCFVVSG
jgi:hypothetical protein